MSLLRLFIQISKATLIHIKYIFVKFYYEQVLVYNSEKQAYKVTKPPFSNKIIILPEPEATKDLSL